MPALSSARPFVAVLAASSLAAIAPMANAQAPRAERFETHVRPLLVERCHGCHGPEKQESGLRLDHGAFVRRGGSRGPAVVPADPDASLMLRAISYQDADLQMPPKGKLAAAEIDELRRWVAEGAFWPDEPEPAAGDPAPAFDLEGRRTAHWCWSPPADVAPPAVDDARFARSPIDRFVRARLAAADLRPAPAADRTTWIRRVTFDLTGLPPTPEEVDAFVGDARADAEARATVVDRLLASPHFGERMARHWMDLVRYSGTMGHEYDFPILEPWRYRDYLIRAFNADLPYDRLIVEHLAGDLVEPQRRDPATGLPESPLGTTSLWFMDQTHSPVDSRQALSDRIDNAIDVTSKTFLGVTVACARCHDHKFDAIATTDYYALFGVLESSRYLTRVLETPDAPAAHHRAAAAHAGLRDGILAAGTAEHGWFGNLLLASLDLPPPPPPAAHADDRERSGASRQSKVEAAAELHGVCATRLERLDALLRSPEVGADPAHPLAAFRTIAIEGVAAEAHWGDTLATRAAPLRRNDDVVLLDARRPLHEQAFVDGPAFANVLDPVTIELGTEPTRVRALAGPWIHSGAASPRAMGSVHSHSFELDRRYLHVLVAGRDARFNLVVNGFNLIRDPIYGSLKQIVDHEDPRWRTIDVELWMGNTAYLQLCDLAGPDPAHPGREGGYGENAWIAVARAVLSDDPAPPIVAAAPPAEWLGKAPPADVRDLARRYDSLLTATLHALRDGTAAPARGVALLDSIGRHGLLPPADAKLQDAFAAAERAIPRAALATTSTEGDPVQAHVHVRGSHRSLGELVPRRFLLALGGERFAGAGSGRLELARRIADPDNPLTARVLVNRIWHHLFGRGIVPTVDNFGVLGEAPSHPDLLDWLALRFVEDGWSIKQLVRRIAVSETYALASAPADPRAAAIDPENRLLHRARVRRLQGEAIRDALLAISGRLDRRMFGPGVPVHLTRFMDGRGRPDRSGPRDGDGRRSVYLEVRRNFLDPMFLAFDTPIPFSTVGARSVSNVPAQALALMNGPFVQEQARLWAQRVLERDGLDDAARVTRLYREAFARPPNADELDAALEFLERQGDAHGGCGPDDVRPWSDLAHVLVNVKEFVFLP